jgi:hypothetical protein
LTRAQRSEAARLGWETRRDNERREAERFERRSEAARLGWETRRDNILREQGRWDSFPWDDWDYVEEPIDDVDGDYFG